MAFQNELSKVAKQKLVKCQKCHHSKMFSQIFTTFRTFKTGKMLREMVKLPVQLFGIEGRYASALFSAASKQNTLEAVEEDLNKFQELIKSDEQLHNFIRNPTIQRTEKSLKIKNVASKINLTTETTNMLEILAENGRLKLLDGVINAFKILMAAHRGEVDCLVTTAKELDNEQMNKLKEALQHYVKDGEKIIFRTKVDPSILGGMIVSIGDKYVDMSVATKIRKYTEIISSDI